MPSQEYAPQEDGTSSLGESAIGNKRKAPEDSLTEDEEVNCPCGAGMCTLLTSTKPQSQGRKFYRCPKPKGEGQCGFFRFQDQPAEKARKPFNYAQASDGSTGYEDTVRGDKPPGSSQALQCHCGQDAVEITSHSAANPDRVFYKCPKTQAEGRCRFFKWQDELGNGPTAPQQQPGPAVLSPQGMGTHGKWMSNKSHGLPAAAAGGSGVFADEGDDFDDNFGFDDAGNTDAGVAARSAYTNHAPGSEQQDPQQGFGGAPTSPGGVQPPEVLNCSCNLQCSYIMAKTAKNDGRWFYRCPKPQDGGQCRFFQWADELGQQTSPSAGRGGGGRQYTRPPPAAAAAVGEMYAAHAYSSPTKVGAGTGGAAPSSDTCFKCGQAGHWSRDCPNGGGGGVAGGGSSGTCFKCGQEGHWSRDCPNPGSGGGRGGGGGRGYGGRGSSGYGGGYGGSSGYSGNKGGGGGRGGGAGGDAATGACYKCGQPGHWSTSCPN
ncbi:hypothetical protein WJX77_007617 [Trebouxia sp. C0004]